MSLPGPPVLKTTIIQLNKELDVDLTNYEILTNDYLGTESSPPVLVTETTFSPPTPKKKRRRLMVNVDQEELTKRKHETKQLHLIIEKRRRIKINREFEALKYLIPACRNQLVTLLPQIKPRGGVALGNKIDGMYKLTILKLLVEYILYLHHIIRRQYAQLAENDPNFEFDISFAKVPLDVNQYRNIDKDFNFANLGDDNKSESAICESKSMSPSFGPTYLLGNHRYTTQRRVLNPVLPHTVVMPLSLLRPVSALTSPSMPLLLSNLAGLANFTLPEPALTADGSDAEALPRKKMFKSRAPSDVILNQGVLLTLGELENEGEIKDEDAGRTLLAMKKLSIGNLLN